MTYNLCCPISILLRLVVSMNVMFTCLFGGWLWMGQSVILDKKPTEPTNQKHEMYTANEKQPAVAQSTNQLLNKINQSQHSISKLRISRYPAFQRVQQLNSSKTENANKSDFTNFLYFLSGKSRIANEREYIPWRVSEVFQTNINERDNRIFSKILQKFVEIAEGHNLTYFLYSGSLLGSFRHHGMIPWDDDIDVIMNFTQSEQITRVFSNLWPHFFLYTKQQVRWKFYASLSHPIRGSPWGWPFIDVSFYQENHTHIWDSDPVFSKRYCYEKSAIFPLIRRPFAEGQYPAPKNTEGVLRQTYHVETCQSNVYSHRYETNLSTKEQHRVSCLKLRDMTPLVFRNKTKLGCNETLWLGNKVVHSVLVPS